MMSMRWMFYRSHGVALALAQLVTFLGTQAQAQAQAQTQAAVDTASVT